MNEAAPAPGIVGTPIPITVASPSLLAKIELMLVAFEAKAKADEASAKTYITKYWPVAVGIVIAATRFIHL